MVGNMDSELLLKFIGYFPDYLLALSRTLLHSFRTTFVETAVYRVTVVVAFAQKPFNESPQADHMLAVKGLFTAGVCYILSGCFTSPKLETGPPFVHGHLSHMKV